jgi:hypothetical protein
MSAACFALLLAIVSPPSLAKQHTCGYKPKNGTKTKATLALADQDPETVAGATYGRRTGERQMTLVYTVTGCRLVDGLAAPASPPPIGPPKDQAGNTIPFGVIRLDGAPEVDGNRYIVRLIVSTRPAAIIHSGDRAVEPSFDPGTYAGFLHLNAPWMRRVGTPIAISRSENQRALVAGLAVAGAVAGFLVFWALHWFADAALLVGRPRFAFAGLASIVIGAGTAYSTNYLNQGVWTFESNWQALLTAAFTSATAGPLVAGLLAKVYDDKQPTAMAVKQAAQAARQAAAQAAHAKQIAPEQPPVT